MKMILAYLAALGAVSLALPAFAADDTSMSVLPLYKLLEPYLVMIVGFVVTTALGWIGMILKARFGIDLDAAMSARIQDAATNAAGAVLARMEGPIGTMAIDLRSPLVKQGVDLLMSKVPDAIAHFGLTPDEVARIVQGKLGVLQAVAPKP